MMQQSVVCPIDNCLAAAVAVTPDSTSRRSAAAFSFGSGGRPGAAPSRGRQAVARSLGDETALEVSDRAEDVEDQLVDGGGCRDVLQ